MISLGLLIVLAWQFYLGYNRGLVRQVYELVAFLLAFVVASFNYQSLADRFTLWVPYAQATEEVTLVHFSDVNVFEMDSVFYAGLAFVALLVSVYTGLKLLGFVLGILPIKQVDRYAYRWLAGGLSVLVTVMFWSVVLNLLATIPFTSLQNLLAGNGLMKGLLNLPFISQLCRYFWVVKILG